MTIFNRAILGDEELIVKKHSAGWYEDLDGNQIGLKEGTSIKDIKYPMHSLWYDVKSNVLRFVRIMGQTPKQLKYTDNELFYWAEEEKFLRYYRNVEWDDNKRKCVKCESARPRLNKYAEIEFDMRCWSCK